MISMIMVLICVAWNVCNWLKGTQVPKNGAIVLARAVIRTRRKVRLSIRGSDQFSLSYRSPYNEVLRT